MLILTLKKIEKVYINDKLSPFSQEFFYQTRRFQKVSDQKFSWSSGEVVLMRENETSMVVLIRCVKDLENYSKKQFKIKLHG